MALPVRPGVFAGMFGKIIAQEKAASFLALSKLAAAVEKQAKINASNGAHKRGTPTTARPGEGPAVISGTLRRSITHTTPVPSGLGWECRVGTAVGAYPPYGRRSDSSTYGLALETGLRNGAKYPFLGPAAKFVSGPPALIIFRSVYGAAFRF
ncbi:hypothetical protein [Embleya sp. NPDC005971]|uniref:hypothetical protein n=1 Tax=Embleya sp. NPDC005971 TaxID=3156724 RepID=UPI0033D01477